MQNCNHHSLKASTLVLGLVVGILASACSLTEQIRVQPPTNTPRLSQTNDWQIYQNSTFGLSFQYPPSMSLLLDEPDTSGIQLQDENLMLRISLNPKTSTTLEQYVFQLRDTGFTERRRTPINKGSWKGVRLEGTATDKMFGINFEEVIYLVRSKDSLLSLTALYDEPPEEYPVVDIVWDSLQLRFDSFALSPALLSPESFTTFTSGDDTFSFRYPTSWQATPSSESLVNIVNLSDIDSLLLSADRRQRRGLNLDEAVEQQMQSLRAPFKNVITESELPASVAGAADGRQLRGSLRFNDGAPGKFQILVAMTPNDIYVIIVIFDASKAESLLPVIDEIFQSLAVS